MPAADGGADVREAGAVGQGCEAQRSVRCAGGALLPSGEGALQQGLLDAGLH